MSEYSFEDGVAAVEGALATESNADEPSLFRPQASESQTPSTATETSAPQRSDTGTTPTPATPNASTPGAEDTGSFIERADLDALLASTDDPAARQAIETAYKSFQSGFTKAQQASAPYRKIGDETGLDVDTLRQAADLYHTIQNPENWQQLYDELSEALGHASTAEDEPEMPQVPNLDLDAFSQDPELAPLAGVVKGLQDEIAALRQERQEEKATQQQEAQRLALVGEIQRQEGVIRSNNPHYQDEDWADIYDLAPGFDWNLLKAQERFEGLKSRVLKAYLDGKQQVGDTPIAPVAGGGTVSEQPRNTRAMPLSDVTDMAMETLRAAGLDTLQF